MIPSLLSGLPTADVERVLSVASRRSFAADEVIHHEGGPADGLHLITAGRVAVMSTCPHGQQLTFAILGRDQFFGEVALLSADGAHGATVKALEPTETLAVARRDFETLLRQHPVVAATLARSLAERVRRLSAQLQETVCLSVEARVRRRLVELAGIYDHGSAGTVIPLTQEDLAGLAGTARATVNRILRQEEALGSVLLGRHRVTVVDVAALARRAETSGGRTDRHVR